jgi:hypothetical protein
LKKHDRSYRLLFSQPRMIQDLIRRFVPEPWIDELDFRTLERVNGSLLPESALRVPGERPKQSHQQVHPSHPIDPLFISS